MFPASIELKQNKLDINTKNNNIQLAPAIVSDTPITYDDVPQALEQYFDDYNYNAAYTTQSYVYRPPICPDKFLNFLVIIGYQTYRI